MNPKNNIIEMAKDQLVPDSDITVLSYKNQKVAPKVCLLLMDADKYTVVDHDTYSKVYDMITEWDTLDLVNFTQRWEDGAIVVTRAFLEDKSNSPVVESVIRYEKKEATEGNMWVRNDILLTYAGWKAEKLSKTPNIHASHSFVYELFMNQDLDWEDILAASSGKLELSNLVLSNDKNGVENFLLRSSIRKDIKFICDTYNINEKGMDQLRAATLAIQDLLVSMVDTVTSQIFEEVNDVNREKVLKSSVHTSSVALIYAEQTKDYTLEEVYALVKDDEVYLVFGALNLDDAKNDFLMEFDLEESDLSGLKVVNFIYHPQL